MSQRRIKADSSVPVNLLWYQLTRLGAFAAIFSVMLLCEQVLEVAIQYKGQHGIFNMDHGTVATEIIDKAGHVAMDLRAVVVPQDNGVRLGHGQCVGGIDCHRLVIMAAIDEEEIELRAQLLRLRIELAGCPDAGG